MLNETAPVADETQPQAQPAAQPQAQPAPDPAHVILSAAQADNKTKADAWEIYHNHEGQEFESKLAATSLPQDIKAAMWQAKTREATTKSQMAQQKQTAPQQDSVENFLDKAAKTNDEPILPGAVKGVYQAGKGLYHGLAGDEATPSTTGPTSTASPVASNVGFTPSNVGYNLGKMGHGIYEFGKEAVKDIAGTTSVAIPDAVSGKPNASFWDRVKGAGDPTAHTLMAKYITAPSQAERDASQREMEEYFKTQGPGAAGHAISAFLHGTLGEYVPAIGPLAMAITEQAQKGDIGGAMAQIAGLYAFEKGTGAAKEGLKDRVNAKVAEIAKTPEVKQAEANVDTLGKERDAAQAKLDAAKAKHQQYAASHQQGIGSPEKVVNEIKKAQDVYDEAEAHHELAKEDLAKKQASSTLPKQIGGAAGRAISKVLPTPAPAPEVPAEHIEATPVLGKLGAKETPLPKIGQTVSPAHATTTIPQEPTEAPKSSYGSLQLPDGSPIGTQRLLAEGNPEGPQVPKGGLPKIKLPEEKPVAPKPVTDEGALRDLKATKGELVESPEKKVGRLLQEALKPENIKPKLTENYDPAKDQIGVREKKTYDDAVQKVGSEDKTEHRAAERRAPEATLPEGQEDRRQGERRTLREMNERTFTEGHTGKGGEKPIDTDAYAAATEQARKELGPDASKEAVIARRNELVAPEAKGATGDIGAKAREVNPEPTRAETKPVLPKEEPTGYVAKQEEVVPAGSEGREPVKSAAEYHPAVQQKVGELSDTNLKQLAKAHGLNPDEYNFNARDERRHRTERDQLAKDITAEMGEDEKINLGRAADATEKQGLFQGADTSAKGRAARAEKMFPRLRGPVDENGNPKVSGGAPDTHEVSVPEKQKEVATWVLGGLQDKWSDPIWIEENNFKKELKPEDIGQLKEGKLSLTKDPQVVAEAIESLEAQAQDMVYGDKGSPELKESVAFAKQAQKLADSIRLQAGIPEELPHYRIPKFLEDKAKGVPVDEFGNPKVSGGAPDEEPTTAGGKETVETAKSDNEHFANAKTELGPKASISEVAKRAQELKDTHAQLAEHEKNGGSTFSSKGKDLNGTDKYSVGAYPDRTEQVDKLTPERLEEFKKKNADVLSKDDHAVGTWKDPDTGKAVLDVTKLYSGKDEAIAAGKAANQKAIYHLGGDGEIQTGGTGKPTPSSDNAKLSDEELKAKGWSQEDIDAGEHLPSVSGGAPEKKLPTGDQLIKKYGESSGDPKDLTFILKDGRGVKNTGNIHDEMLGGKATDKNPPRERFVAEGNIRVRPHQGAGGREVTFSIPESGVSSDQLKYIQKMSSQLRSGAMLLEVGKPGGSYKTIPYGEATPEAIEKAVRDLGPVLNAKGSPIDEFGNPTVSGGSPAAGTGVAKAKDTPEDLQKSLPDLAQQHLTDEEKDSITTTATGKPRTAGTAKFIENMEKIPTVQEYTDIALQGEGARKWYSRSTAAFDAMHDEAPDYFKKGDKEKFMGVLAGSSPQQSVAMNLRETLGFWKEWNDAGRPEFSLDKWKKFGEEADKAWKDDGSPRTRGMSKGASMHWDYAPKGNEWKAENLLLKNLTLPETKVPNIIKALNGENMWPDLTKNQAFKAPSFAENLRKWIGGKSTGTKSVTNDSWMGLFGGIDKSALSKPENYHPLSVATRAAAQELGWEPEEAQAAIWSFTQALTEKGVEEPELIRHYSEDFKDLLENDIETRSQLEGLGVNLDQLDSKLAAIGEKPEVSGRSTPTTANSVVELKRRIEKARGEGTIPEPKTVQGNLFRENPAFEQKSNPGAGHTRDEGTRFDPEDFKNEESGLTKLGEKKKSPYGNVR
jgi:hypothetical protein